MWEGVSCSCLAVSTQYFLGPSFSSSSRFPNTGKIYSANERLVMTCINDPPTYFREKKTFFWAKAASQRRDERGGGKETRENGSTFMGSRFTSPPPPPARSVPSYKPFRAKEG